jgi:hypothetical protein
MKITAKWLHDRNACQDSFDHVKENGYLGLDGISFIEKLIENNRVLDASWLIVRCMNKKQCVQYAVFAAEQALHLFENEYPNDTRPRDAINAAKAYIKNPCRKTKDAAYAAYAAAYAAADAAGAAAYAAYAAAGAAACAVACDVACAVACDVACAAYAAVGATAYTTVYTTAGAARAAVGAAYAAGAARAARAAAAGAAGAGADIINYGLKLLIIR